MLRSTTVFIGLVLALLAPPAFAQELQFLQVLTDGVGGVEGLAGPRMAALSPDGTSLYVAAEPDNAVSVFDRDPDTGLLTFVEVEVDGVNGVDGLLGADAVAVSPDGQNVYVGSAFEAAVAVFDRDPGTGTLTFVEAEFDGVGGVTGLGVTAWVSVSPDGNFLYASGFADNAIVAFARNPADGTLTYIETEFNGVGGVTNMTGPFGHEISPDGEHLYVASLMGSAVVIFDRNPATGTLSFLASVVDGVGGVDGIGGARTVTVSPDGANVYVAGLADSAVAAFERNPGTGLLTFLEAEFDNVNGVNGLSFPGSAFLDPSGSVLITSSFGEDAVGVFTRLPGGELEFVGAVFDGVGDTTGIFGTLWAGVSPDGQNVYATGFVSDTLAVFGFDLGGAVLDIPTLSQVGLAGLALVLAAAAFLVLRRRTAV